MSAGDVLRRLYRSAVPSWARGRIHAARRKARSLSSEVSARLALECNVCRGRRITRFRNPQVARLPFDFFACADCGLIFLHPTPDTSFYAGAEVPAFVEEDAWNGVYLDCVERHAGRRGRLLELGFGSGGFLALARERGWEVSGVDLNPRVVEHARARGLADTRAGTLEEAAFPSEQFDVVVALNFLEHVPDPRRTLTEIRRLLRVGGVAVVLCPNLGGIYHLLVQELLGESDRLQITWEPPAHIYYFNKENLGRLLADVGFDVTADESALTTSLWQQHAERIGQEKTDSMLKRLIEEMNASPLPKGEARLHHYRPALQRLVGERLTWSLVRDVVEIEGALGAENAALLIGRKVDARSAAA